MNSYGGPQTPGPGSQEPAGAGYNPSGYDQYAWEKKLAGGIAQADNTGIYQLDATGRPVELYSPRPVYELSDQPYTHELMGEGRHPATTTTHVPSITVQESPILNK